MRAMRGMHRGAGTERAVAHWSTDKHVGKAMPLDTFLPLYTLPQALHARASQSGASCTRGTLRSGDGVSTHSSIASSPRSAMSTSLAPGLHASLTAATTPAQHQRFARKPAGWAPSARARPRATRRRSAG